MRAPPAAMSCGTSSLVNSKCPRWFVPNCVSKPSAVRPNGVNITPALFISTWIADEMAPIATAADRTSASEVRSNRPSTSRAAGTSSRIHASASARADGCAPRG